MPSKATTSVKIPISSIVMDMLVEAWPKGLVARNIVVFAPRFQPHILALGME
jgi:hypothetical protein